MARTPEVGNPRTVVVALRLTPSEVDALDKKRGNVSRGRYIRRLINVDTGRASTL